MTAVTTSREGHTVTRQRPLDVVPALTDFLHQRSRQNTQMQNKSKLSPKELQALSDELNSSGRVKPMDVDATKSNLYGIKKKWVLRPRALKERPEDAIMQGGNYWSEPGLHEVT